LITIRHDDILQKGEMREKFYRPKKIGNLSTRPKSFRKRALFIVKVKFVTRETKIRWKLVGQRT